MLVHDIRTESNGFNQCVIEVTALKNKYLYHCVDAYTCNENNKINNNNNNNNNAHVAERKIRFRGNWVAYNI